MPDYQANGRTYIVDEDGFLQDAELWSEEVAMDFAVSENLTSLSDEHWKLIRYIREYYDKFGIAPMVRKLCRDTGLALARIYELFPSGPAKGACKVAGLPKPAGCV